jgi:hypothetical protein
MVVALLNLALYTMVSLGIMYVSVIFSGVNSRTITSEIKKQVKDTEAKLMVVNYISFIEVKDVGVPVIDIGNMESMPVTISEDKPPEPGVSNLCCSSMFYVGPQLVGMVVTLV